MRVFEHSKGKVNVVDMPKWIYEDKFYKVINSFIKVLSKYLSQNSIISISKQEFMNHSMLLYSGSKDIIDTLVRTYENLNKAESKLNMTSKADISRNSLISCLSKDSKQNHDLNQSSKESSSKLKTAAKQIKNDYPLTSRKQSRLK